MIDTASHPKLTFALDIADKAIKLAAVAIGGFWTWWNYRKSRTYEQKLDLEVVGTVFRRDALFGDIKVVVKNIGGTKHPVQHTGTFCEVSVIRRDLTQQSIRIFRVFTHSDRIEPGESIVDTHYWRILTNFDDIVWVKLDLRVVSGGLEWRWSCLIRVEIEEKHLSPEVV